MAIPNPNESQLNWKNLGQKTPILNQWQGYLPFSQFSGTLRVTAFSLNGNYDGYCHLRVKYVIPSLNTYSKWIRIYPDPLPSILSLKIDINFNDYDKIIEIIDFRPPSSTNLANPRKWSLKLDLLL